MRADRWRNLSTERKSEIGRMGRGEDAFSPKEARWWIKTKKRIQVIVEREAQKSVSIKTGHTEALSAHLRLKVGELGTLVEVV